MKRLAALLCISLAFGANVHGQTENPTTIVAINSPTPSLTSSAKSLSTVQDTSATLPVTDKYNFFIGPYLLAKGSVKTAVATGFKTGPAFGADMGVTTLFPFGRGSNFGAGFDIGHATYGFIVKPENEDSVNDQNTIRERYSYINFSPYIYVAGFTLGINVGFPNNAYGRYIEGANINMLTDTAGNSLTPRGIEVAKHLSTLLEVRIGGMIPLITTETGRWNLNLQAGYVLSGMYSDYKTYYGAYEREVVGGVPLPAKSREALNPQVASGSIGLSYLFNVRP